MGITQPRSPGCLPVAGTRGKRGVSIPSLPLLLVWGASRGMLQDCMWCVCVCMCVCVGGRLSADFPLMPPECCFSLSLPFSLPCFRVSANREKLAFKNDTLAKSLGEAFFLDPSGYTLTPIQTWDMNDTTLNRPGWHILLTRCGPTPSVISEGFRKRRVRSRLSQQWQSTVQCDCMSLTRLSAGKAGSSHRRRTD